VIILGKPATGTVLARFGVFGAALPGLVKLASDSFSHLLFQSTSPQFANPVALPDSFCLVFSFLPLCSLVNQGPGHQFEWPSPAA